MSLSIINHNICHELTSSSMTSLENQIEEFEKANCEKMARCKKDCDDAKTTMDANCRDRLRLQAEQHATDRASAQAAHQQLDRDIRAAGLVSCPSYHVPHEQ